MCGPTFAVARTTASIFRCHAHAPIFDNAMHPLATLYFPDLNPIGPGSIFAVLITGLFVCMTSDQPFGLPLKTRRRCSITATWLFGLIVVFITAAGQGRVFPDAHELVGFIVFIVFGLAFALQDFKYQSWPAFTSAAIWSLVCGTILITFTNGILPNPLSNGVVVLITAYWLLWLFLVIWRYDRLRKIRMIERELCAECGYNLTGNVSRTCPECGCKIQSKITKAGHA